MPRTYVVYNLRKLFDIIEPYLPEVHSYADDTQMYLAFKPVTITDQVTAVNALGDCLHAVRNWMLNDKLMINDTKTEFLVIGTKQQLSKINIDHIIVGNNRITPVPCVKNLGFWFDENFKMDLQISKTCNACFLSIVQYTQY